MAAHEALAVQGGGLPADHEVVARVRAGDASAFEMLFRTFHAEMWTFAEGYVRSGEVAEDIVQEVFLTLWEQRAQWVVRDTVRRYLFGAVRNRAVNEIRRRGVMAKWAERAEYEPELQCVSSGPPPIEDTLRERHLEHVVMNAVEALPARRRQAFLLRWRHQLTYPEIAAAMGISQKGVEALLARALATVRAAVGEM